MSIINKIILVHGPNLNLIGQREPELYGKLSFQEYFKQLQQMYPQVELIYFQSNIEGELINTLQQYGFLENAAIILNAGAYTHTSIALADCIKGITTPVYEIHISNIYAREEYRKTSYIAAVCQGSISGFGLSGYEILIAHLIK